MNGSYSKMRQEDFHFDGESKLGGSSNWNIWNNIQSWLFEISDEEIERVRNTQNVAIQYQKDSMIESMNRMNKMERELGLNNEKNDRF